MSPLSTSAKNQMLNNLATTAVFASLHSTYPGDTGAGEISGGTPVPYARQAVTWNAAAGGNLDNLVSPTFVVPAATTIRWLGLWSLITAGTWLGSVPLGATASHAFYATDAGDVLYSDNHGYTNGQSVVLQPVSSFTLPAGLAVGTVYYVVSATTDTLQLSATSGGAAITLTSDGMGWLQLVVPETFNGQGSYAVSDIDIMLNLLNT